MVLWLLDGSRRLGASAREQVLTTPVVHVSAASVLELTIKAMLGRLEVPTGLVETLEADGYHLLSITAADAEAIRSWRDLAHHDPFDRMLLAQAVGRGLRLVTADRALLALRSSLPDDMLVDATT